jgi:hypothetical protein
MNADDADSEAMPADRWIGRRSSGARAEWLKSTRAAAFEDTAQGFWKNALVSIVYSAIVYIVMRAVCGFLK